LIKLIFKEIGLNIQTDSESIKKRQGSKKMCQNYIAFFDRNEEAKTSNLIVKTIWKVELV